MYGWWKVDVAGLIYCGMTLRIDWMKGIDCLSREQVIVLNVGAETIIARKSSSHAVIVIGRLACMSANPLAQPLSEKPIIKGLSSLFLLANTPFRNTMSPSVRDPKSAEVGNLQHSVTSG